MPFCRLCRDRIDVAKTGVISYRCRKCGKMFCRNHIVLDKNLCLACAGYSPEEIAIRTKNLKSFTRSS
ncbi:hypothetical protein ACFL5I_00915 [Planctomycetota bacterium]